MKVKPANTTPHVHEISLGLEKVDFITVMTIMEIRYHCGETYAMASM